MFCALRNSTQYLIQGLSKHMKVFGALTKDSISIKLGHEQYIKAPLNC